MTIHNHNSYTCSLSTLHAMQPPSYFDRLVLPTLGVRQIRPGKWIPLLFLESVRKQVSKKERETREREGGERQRERERERETKDEEWEKGTCR